MEDIILHTFTRSTPRTGVLRTLHFFSSPHHIKVLLFYPYRLFLVYRTILKISSSNSKNPLSPFQCTHSFINHTQNYIPILKLLISDQCTLNPHHHLLKVHCLSFPSPVYFQILCDSSYPSFVSRFIIFYSYLSIIQFHLR